VPAEIPPAAVSLAAVAEIHGAGLAVYYVGAGDWHRVLDELLRVAPALRRAHDFEDDLVRFGRLDLEVCAEAFDDRRFVSWITEPVSMKSNSQRHLALVMVFLSMDAYRATCVSSQKATPAARYVSGCGYSSSPPSRGGSSHSISKWRKRPIFFCLPSSRGVPGQGRIAHELAAFEIEPLRSNFATWRQRTQMIAAEGRSR
jgi:hypothetical protein